MCQLIMSEFVSTKTGRSGSNFRWEVRSHTQNGVNIPTCCGWLAQKKGLLFVSFPTTTISGGKLNPTLKMGKHSHHVQPWVSPKLKWANFPTPLSAALTAGGWLAQKGRLIFVSFPTISATALCHCRCKLQLQLQL